MEYAIISLCIIILYKKLMIFIVTGNDLQLFILSLFPSLTLIFTRAYSLSERNRQAHTDLLKQAK